MDKSGPEKCFISPACSSLPIETGALIVWMMSIKHGDLRVRGPAPAVLKMSNAIRLTILVTRSEVVFFRSTRIPSNENQQLALVDLSLIYSRKTQA